MIADGLTKDDGTAADRLRAVLRGGLYRIGNEAEALERNRKEKDLRIERGKTRALAAEQRKSNLEARELAEPKCLGMVPPLGDQA